MENIKGESISTEENEKKHVLDVCANTNFLFMIRNHIPFQSSLFYYFVWLINKDFSKGLSLNTMKIWFLYSCDNNNRNDKHKRYHNKYDKNVWRLYLHFNHVWIKVRLRLAVLQPVRLLAHRQVSENHIFRKSILSSSILSSLFLLLKV